MVSESTDTPRQRRRRANVQRILDEAFALIAQDGVAGLSMARLAEACDYTPGALYRYYRSKDAIIAALVSRVIDELGVDAEARRGEHEDPLERVVVAARVYRDFSVQAPHRFALLAALLASADRLLPEEEEADPVMQDMIRVLTPLGADLAAATAAGALHAGNVIERAMILFASLHGILSFHKQARIAPHLIDLDRLVVASVRTLLIGWGADEEAADQAVRAVLGPFDAGEPS